MKHRRPALPGAKSLKAGALGVAAISLLTALAIPSTTGFFLVSSALFAGLLAILVSSRATGVDSRAWLFLGVGQVCNGIGNLAIAADARAWFAEPDWFSTMVFSAATFATVVGLVVFVMPPRHTQLVGAIACDLVVILGCAFVLGWTWDVPRVLGGANQSADLLGLVAFLAIVLDLIGIALTGLLWRSRPHHQQVAVRLVAIALVVGTFGDTGLLTEHLQLSSQFASLSWVVSSLLLLVGATFVPALATQRFALSERPFLAIATAFLAITVVIVTLDGGPKDIVVEAALAIVVLTLLARQSHMAYTTMRLAERLTASERHYRNLVDGTQDVIVVVGDDGRISYASPSAHDLFGIDSSELPGIDASLLLGANDLSKAQAAFAGLPVGKSERVEIKVDRPDGTARQVEALCSRSKNGYIVSLRDVTERVEIMRKVEEAASRDALTGLPNRRSFEDALRTRLGKTGHASVVFCDLDGFKRVNDTSGHAAGDSILIQVAHRLEKAMGEDFVARFGGDEFAILLRKGISREAAVALVQHAQATVAGTYRVSGQEITMLMTAGLTVEDSASPAEIMRNADLALYQAKATGRGALRLFELAMYEGAMRRVELDERLRKALTTNALSVVYQPVIDTDTGDVVAAEALVRWIDDNGEVMTPQELVNLAETTGSVSIMGEWVLARAIEQAAAWKHAGHPIPVAVNVSAEQLLVGDLAHTIQRLLRMASLEPELLTLEITESVLVDEAETAIGTMDRLHSIGIRIAIDDFGTGYSSFAYLGRLPVDHLKIDRYFVADVGRDETGTAIVRTMTQMSHDLGLTVTAEGVETLDQLTALAEMGVRRMQGYLVAKPSVADEVLALARTGWTELPDHLRLVGAHRAADTASLVEPVVTS